MPVELRAFRGHESHGVLVDASSAVRPEATLLCAPPVCTPQPTGSVHTKYVALGQCTHLLAKALNCPLWECCSALLSAGCVEGGTGRG